MNLACFNDPDPSPSTSRPQGIHPGRRSLPPANSLGSQYVLPSDSYPSSTLHYYYPAPQRPPNYAHILPSASNFQSHFPLPSASQSHIPSLRRTPSVPVPDNIHIAHVPSSPFIDQRNNEKSRNSQRIQSLSPIAFHEPQPLHNFPASPPIHIPNNSLPSPVINLPHPRVRTNTTVPPQHQISFINSSLPSTKDVPLLTGKHDWGPWHSAVRTLILNANLLGHIADDPLPGAAFDPGLWPTYPPTVHQRSSHADLQTFTDWWSRDGIASHILTSRLSSSVLGSLPIANERMGHR